MHTFVQKINTLNRLCKVIQLDSDLASEILLIFVTEFFLGGYQLNDKTGKQLKIIIKEEKNIFFFS